MDYRRLLDPKGAAKDEMKDKVKKRTPNYGPQQARKPILLDGDESKPRSTTVDAKALTDPKPPSASKPKPETFNVGSKISPLKFDPKALLAPKSAAGQSRATVPAMEARNSDQVVNLANGHAEPGMGDFISRLNNLESRTATPPTKRKSNNTDEANFDDEERKKSKSTFAGATNGGEIGEYMKSQRQKGAEEAGPSMETIDLTNDDEDDLVIVKAGHAVENKEVCLGMLHSQASAFLIPNGRKFQANGPNKTFWPQTRVNYKRSQAKNNIIELLSPTASNTMTGTRFGTLDNKLASVLCPLLDGSNVAKMRLKIYLDPFERKPGEHPGANISRSLKRRVIIYAPRGKGQTIGRFLSQRQIFLSKPIMVEPGVEYENPHEAKVIGGATKGSAGGKFQSSAVNYVTRTQEEMLRETSDMFDSLVKSEDLPEKEADENSIVTPLMSHQKQALHFLTSRERDTKDIPDDDANFSLWKTIGEGDKQAWYNVITNQKMNTKPEPSRGGILADVMGLGKTLSILALIADTRQEAIAFGKSQAPVDDENIIRNCKATLIICPKSVMANWQEQIKTHTKTKYFKVHAYHGTNRQQDLEVLAECDIVLAPYQTVAVDFNNMKSTVSKKPKALTSINWFRVVLDEAHMIRNPSTHVSKACCKLSAQRRWAVTGTPVQNRLDDLGALIRFLRIKPFDDSTVWSQYIIGPFKAASEHVITHLRLLVDSITLRRMKDRVGLMDKKQLRVVLEFSDDEMLMYTRFAKESNRQLRVMLAENDRLRGKSYAHVLKSLGRLRAICAHGREMLSEDDQKELDGLTAATAIDLGDEPGDSPDESFITEKHAYEYFTMMNESEVDRCIGCDNKIGEGKDGGSADVTQLANDSDSDSDSDSASSSDESSIEPDDTMGYLTPCFHLLCPKCKDSYITDTETKLTSDHYHTCAYCEQYVRWGLFELTRPGLKAMLDARANKNKKGKHAKWDESTYSGPHTKVKALLADLEESSHETAQLPSTDPPIRSVVFSGWTTYLDLIEYALEERQIGFVRLDGSMSIKQRSAVLTTFASDPTITVLLVSIKAGGQGLNFTVANKVYMMEPQFNPGVEHQAIDRVHRLGQKRDVVIKHFIMKDSVEEKILTLQRKKEKLAALSMERKVSRSDEAKQRLQELKDLFK